MINGVKTSAQERHILPSILISQIGNSTSYTGKRSVGPRSVGDLVKITGTRWM